MAKSIGSRCAPWLGRFLATALISTSFLVNAQTDVTSGSSPSAAVSVPVRLGSIDAVQGGLSISIPLGPKLPGRFPFGFSWNFNSRDGQYVRIGGSYRPVMWPSAKGPKLFPLGNLAKQSPTLSIRVGGSQYTFHRHFANASVPTNDQFKQLILDRGALEMEGGDGLIISSRLPSSDGTKWYLELQRVVTLEPEVPGGVPGHDVSAPMKIILDGPNAIWTTDGWNTHLTNRWGEHIFIEETGAVKGSPTRIRITNLRSPSEWVQQDLVLQPGAPFGTYPNGVTEAQATLTVTNSLGLPEVEISGFHRSDAIYGCDWKDSGFLPCTWKVGPSGSVKVTTLLDWTRQCTVGEAPLLTRVVPYARIDRISHLDGKLVEVFSYKLGLEVASQVWSPEGLWAGGPCLEVNDAESISGVTTTGVGEGSSVKIAKKIPGYGDSHETWILNYPKANPSSGDPFRGIRIIHPSRSVYDSDPKGPASFLYSTYAVLAVERIHGTGLPDSTKPPGPWPPAAFERDQIMAMDGWELKSWGNPEGRLADTLPVTAVATRTRTYAPNLPTRISRAGAWDTWGATQTDEYTLSPQPMPSIDGSSLGCWASTLPAESGNIQRTGTITRHWDLAALELVTDTDNKTLQGPDLPSLRGEWVTGADGKPALRGLSSVDFGISTFDYEAGTALLQHTKGTRDGVEASESRVYQSGQALLNEVTKTLNTGATVTTGATYTYDSSVHQWPYSETDKLTGRTTTYNSRNIRGQVALMTDPSGIQIRTDYDDWGRVSTVTRLAKGSVGAVTTTYNYDPAGLWKTETVTADGNNLTTRTDFDAYGRITLITYPDGSTQATGYDGFGQKKWQTPILRPNQTPYGNFTWNYNEKGMLIASIDPQGRRLSSAYDPANPSLVWEPQWVDAEKAVVTKTWDDRGMLRQEFHDLLGQKKKLIDPKGQPTFFSYDRDGRLIQTLQGGQKRRYEYNKAGWLTSRTEPEEGTTTYDGFTSLGVPTLTKMTGRSGQSNVETLTTLDNWQRPIQIDMKSAGTLVTSRTIHYRNDFNVPTDLTETQPNGAMLGTLTETYGYDEIGRLNAKTVSDGTQIFAISRELDSLGAVKSLTYPAKGGRSAQTVTTVPDAFNRPWTVNLDTSERGRMAYGPGVGYGWTDSLTYGNNANLKTTSTMDRGELVNVTHKVASSGAVLPALPGNQQVNYMTWSASGLLLTRGPSTVPDNSANDKFEYDELQRLSMARSVGPGGEVATQWFSYDAWGNRNRSEYFYSFPANGMPKPDELRAWRASYDGSNGLPANLAALNPRSAANSTTPGTDTGALLETGAQYDDLGRVTNVKAIPNDATSLTQWTYDPSGRVTSETHFGYSTNFLLDGEGLRFKRMRTDDASIVYTVYGFNREPLMVLEKPGASAPASLTTTQSKMMAAAAPLDPVGAYILAPIAGTTLYVGQPVTFQGSSDDGSAFTWTFGDGTTGTGATRTKTYSTAGTYTVTLKVAAVSGYSGSTATRTFTVALAPPGIVSFTANPTTILKGQSSTLSWSVTGATTLKINGTTVSGSSLTVSPTVTATYTLSATNAAGTRSATVTVGVNALPPPVIQSFSANASTVFQGQSATLNWSVTGATSLSITGIGTVTGAASISVTPSTTTTYTLTASNATGIATAVVTISVTTPPTLVWTKTLVYGFGSLLSEERPDGTFYVMGDQVGSPSLITTATGTLVGRSKNLPFGERFWQSGTVKSLRRYTNHEDNEGSPIYMQARTYLPAFGKFAQVDPAYDQTKDDPDSWNLYNYVTNNPVTRRDPDGRMRVLDGVPLVEGAMGGLSLPDGSFGTTMLENVYTISNTFVAFVDPNNNTTLTNRWDISLRGSLIGSSYTKVEFQAPSIRSGGGPWWFGAFFGNLGQKALQQTVQDADIPKRELSGVIDGLQHYRYGNGETATYSFDKIDTSSVSIRDFPGIRKLLHSVEPGNSLRTEVSTTMAYKVPGAAYWLLGNITIKATGLLQVTSAGEIQFRGKLTALNDYYDFNKASHRGGFAEVMTTFGRHIEGKNYVVEIPGEKQLRYYGVASWVMSMKLW